MSSHARYFFGSFPEMLKFEFPGEAGLRTDIFDIVNFDPDLEPFSQGARRAPAKSPYKIGQKLTSQITLSKQK
jgi:hypothetical protein